MIAVVDYKAGNLTSVALALHEIGHKSHITSDPSEILSADRVIFPGVGAAGAAMEELNRLNLGPVLKQFLSSGRPFLGICVGCQIIMDWSLENGNTQCLGLLPGGTEVFQPSRTNTVDSNYKEMESVKVPHMGWNQVSFLRSHPVLKDIPQGSDFYFVHSYFPVPEKADDVLATTRYGGAVFASILARRNLVACQFHAEKSGPIGLRLLDNFCQWDGL